MGYNKNLEREGGLLTISLSVLYISKGLISIA